MSKRGRPSKGDKARNCTVRGAVTADTLKRLEARAESEGITKSSALNAAVLAWLK